MRARQGDRHIFRALQTIDDVIDEPPRLGNFFLIEVLAQEATASYELTQVTGIRQRGDFSWVEGQNRTGKQRQHLRPFGRVRRLTAHILFFIPSPFDVRVPHGWGYAQSSQALCAVDFTLNCLERHLWREHFGHDPALKIKDFQ